MASFFPPYHSKTLYMPNQANRSKDQSSIVKPKRKGTKASTKNPNQEQPDKKQSGSSKGTRGSSNNSNEGNEGASGSNPND